MRFIVKKEDDGRIFISFKYDPDVVTYVKTLKLHKWNPTGKNWEIGPADLDKLKLKYNEASFEDWKDNNGESNEFCQAIKDGIERLLAADESVPSQTLKPSGLHCERCCYYVLKGKVPDRTEIKYSWSNCAETGSMRHEGIQNYLIKLSDDPKFDFKYIDVGEYIKMKQAQGKCLNIRVGSKKSAETHLYCDELKLSFFCDGIIQRKSTGEYYLFEFKNKKSNKYDGCDREFPVEHEDQCICYCMCLDLEKVFLLAENRDNCELVCPPDYKVTEEMKNKMREKLLRIIKSAETDKLPERVHDNSTCRFCAYKKYCTEDELLSGF